MINYIYLHHTKGWIDSMKVISDIRLFKSLSKNEFGSFITESFGSKKLIATIKRIVMKLRENNFSLGEFDHLYINFTTLKINNEIEISNDVDSYHPWYRYCHIKINEYLFNNLDDEKNIQLIIQYVSKVLSLFVTDSFPLIKETSLISQALEQGENMLMKYKEKETKNNKVIVYLRFLDTCKYFPLLRLFDNKGSIILEKDLPESITLDYIGQILVKKENIVIKPKRNAFTKNLDNIVINY